MSKKLTNMRAIETNGLNQELRLSFESDRHHALSIEYGIDRDKLVGRLRTLASRLEADVYLADEVWTAIYTAVGLEARERKFESEEAAIEFLETVSGEILLFLDMPSTREDFRRMARPSTGGSAQYWRET